MAVSIATIHVNGIAEFSKRSKVFASLKANTFDLYVLQETHLADLNQGEHWQKLWGGHALWSTGTNRSSSVGLLIKPGSAIEIVNHRADSDGRVLCTKLCLGNKISQVLNVYTPNDHSIRGEFFSNLRRYAFCNVDTVMAGDFNCIPDPRLDKWGGDDTFGDQGIEQLNVFASLLAGRRFPSQTPRFLGIYLV